MPPTHWIQFTVIILSLHHLLSLTVPPTQPTIKVNDSRSSYVEGDFISLTCETTGANPKPVFQWTKRASGASVDVTSELLTNEHSVAKNKSSSQIVVPVDYTDHQATYTCSVYNSINQNSPLTVSKDFTILCKSMEMWLNFMFYLECPENLILTLESPWISMTFFKLNSKFSE